MSERQYTMQMLVATEYPPGFSSCGFRKPRQTQGARSPLRVLRVVHAELVAQRVADLAYGATGAQRLAHRRQKVRIAACGLAHALEEGGGFFWVPFSEHRRRACGLPPCACGGDPMQLVLSAVSRDVLFHADDPLPPRLYLLRVGKGGLLDLALDKALFDRRDGAAE